MTTSIKRYSYRVYLTRALTRYSEMKLYSDQYFVKEEQMIFNGPMHFSTQYTLTCTLYHYANITHVGTIKSRKVAKSISINHTICVKAYNYGYLRLSSLRVLS